MAMMMFLLDFLEADGSADGGVNLPRVEGMGDGDE
jgi:hypothetical protein